MWLNEGLAVTVMAVSYTHLIVYIFNVVKLEKFFTHFDFFSCRKMFFFHYLQSHFLGFFLGFQHFNRHDKGNNVNNKTKESKRCV